MRETKKSARILLHAVLILGAVVMLIPFAWMILTALNPPQRRLRSIPL